MRTFLIAAAAALTVAATAVAASAQTPQTIAPRYVLAVVGQYAGHPVTAAEVRYFAPLAAAGDPGLVITGARPDLRRGGVDLECRARRDPALPAFTIWMAEAIPAAKAGAAAPAPAPILISPRHVAELDFHQGTMALVAEVQPLQPARRGQHVRALSLATHTVVEVEAIGENQVRLVATP